MRREDVKEDPFQKFITSVIRAYYRSPRNFYIGGAALVAVIAVIVFVATHKPKPDPQPAIMFDEAMLVLSDPQHPDTSNAEQVLTDLSRRYASTPLGKRASYYLGDIYYNQQKYDDAGRQFERFATGVKNDPILSPAAWMGVGNCYEAQGTLDKAAEAYATAFRKYPKWALADQAALSAGRCYRQKGQLKAAEAIYSAYVKANPKASTDALNEVKLQLAYVQTMQEVKNK